MSLDGAFLSCVLQELDVLTGGRVDKIHQPSREEIVISMRTSSGGKKLLLSANSTAARINLTENTAENPKSPPMFCMLLRKYLGSGKLIRIYQDGLERIVSLEFECTNEIGDIVSNTLIVEIMGRHSNIILTSGGKVIDAIKRIDDEISSVRRVLPGVIYSAPPRDNRLCIKDASPQEILDALNGAKNAPFHKVIIAMFEGVSPLFARECAYYAARDVDITGSELTPAMTDRFLFFIKNVKNILNGESEPKYTVVSELTTDKKGKPKDFSFINIEQYGTQMIVSHKQSACELLDSFFGARDARERMRQKSGELLKKLLNIYERIERKIKLQKEELKECRGRDMYRIMGDLINANLYRIEKNSGYLETENFYDDNKVIKIPLDRRLSPAMNAQKYFTEYRKLATAEEKLNELIKNGSKELIYIDSVFDAVSRAVTEQEIAEIRSELAESGYLKKSKNMIKNVKPMPPLKFKSTDGFEILIGRNNKQNDKLTLKDARGDDIWLHTQNIPGSHVIITSGGKTVPDSTIEQAAILAAYCSKARDSAQVPVDYTAVRYVKKPGGAKPGMVIFTGNKTAFVTPDEELYNTLRVR